jgi:hypothetical protein
VLVCRRSDEHQDNLDPSNGGYGRHGVPEGIDTGRP